MSPLLGSPERYVSSMGQDLAEVYAALADDVLWLHSKWIVYRQIFGNDTPARLDKLNRAAGFYFYVTQHVMWNDILLHLARLTDPPRSAGRPNLTLRVLPQRIRDEALARDVTAMVETACEGCDFARVLRNRRIAHNDYEHALAIAESPLPGVSRAQIEAALGRIRDVLNRLENHYMDGTIAYEHTILGRGDGDALARFIELGLEVHDRRIRRQQDLVRRLENGEAVSLDEFNFS